jgi:hypothetical protein
MSLIETLNKVDILEIEDILIEHYNHDTFFMDISSIVDLLFSSHLQQKNERLFSSQSKNVSADVFEYRYWNIGWEGYIFTFRNYYYIDSIKENSGEVGNNNAEEKKQIETAIMHQEEVLNTKSKGNLSVNLDIQNEWQERIVKPSSSNNSNSLVVQHILLCRMSIFQ